jgi:hypothetical protein
MTIFEAILFPSPGMNYENEPENRKFINLILINLTCAILRTDAINCCFNQPDLFN